MKPERRVTLVTMMPNDAAPTRRLAAPSHQTCLILLIFLLFTFPAWSLGGQEKTYGNIHHARFIDAQTAELLVFDIPGVHPLLGDRVKVQIRGMDAPQFAAGCDKEKLLARKARDVVASLLSKGTHITLKDVARSRAFAIRATVLVDNQDIREVLFKAGLAFPAVESTPPRNWCAPN